MRIVAPIFENKHTDLRLKLKWHSIFAKEIHSHKLTECQEIPHTILLYEADKNETMCGRKGVHKWIGG